jgi:hypothetical protein
LRDGFVRRRIGLIGKYDGLDLNVLILNLRSIACEKIDRGLVAGSEEVSTGR